MNIKRLSNIMIIFIQQYQWQPVAMKKTKS